MKIGITERGDAALHFKKWHERLPEVDGAILITKNPGLLLKRLDKYKVPLDRVVIHCTITGWGGTQLEPNVPEPQESLAAHRKLVKRLGSDKVVLRIDPVFPTWVGMERVKTIALRHAESRVLVSFLDMYSHVRDRLEKLPESYLEDLFAVYGPGIHAPLWLRKRLLADITAWVGGHVNVCGEPGLSCAGCVSALDLDAMGLKWKGKSTSPQRKDCACLAIKTELLTRKKPCKHGCLYCYWKEA